MVYPRVRGAPQGPEPDAEMPSITSRLAYSACLLHPWSGHMNTLSFTVGSSM